MNKQKFNRLAAEFLELEIDPQTVVVYVVHDNETMPREFNPYDDANDLCMLEEKLEIYTLPKDGGEWWRTIMSKGNIKGTGKTPHEARRACAWEYLKEWKK